MEHLVIGSAQENGRWILKGFYCTGGCIVAVGEYTHKKGVATRRIDGINTTFSVPQLDRTPDQLWEQINLLPLSMEDKFTLGEVGIYPPDLGVDPRCVAPVGTPYPWQ